MIRQHFQHVVLRLRRIRLRFEHARFRPAFLPLRLDLLWIVSRRRGRWSFSYILFRHGRLSSLLLGRFLPRSALNNSALLCLRPLLSVSARSLHLCVTFPPFSCLSVARNLLLQRRGQHGESFLRRRRQILQPRKLPQCRHVPPVIARIINRRLGQERPPRQRSLRIVYVKHWNIIEPDRAVNLPDRRCQSVLAFDVVSRGKEMRRIEACANRQSSQPS